MQDSAKSAAASSTSGCLRCSPLAWPELKRQGAETPGRQEDFSSPWRPDVFGVLALSIGSVAVERHAGARPFHFAAAALALEALALRGSGGNGFPARRARLQRVGHEADE